MSTKNKIEPLSAVQRDEILNWRNSHVLDVPQSVLQALDQYEKLAHALSSSNYKLRQFLISLRLALGMTPKSERRKSGDPIGATADRNDKKPRDERERLKLTIDRHGGLGAWHRKMAKRHARKVKNAEDKLKSLEEIELTPEEEAEITKENEEYMARLSLGNGQDPALEPAREPFMRGGTLIVTEEAEDAPVDPDLLVGQEIVKRIIDQRTRYDFNLNVSRVTIDVEKVIVKDGDDTKVISGSTRHLGPPKSELTWGFLGNLMVLAAQYAMPFNRLGNMLSTPDKKFTAEMLSGWFAYVAQRFVPVYLHFARQLANAELMSGDDTGNRVVEVSRYFKALKSGKEIVAPWEHYATIDKAKETLKSAGSHDLGTITAAVLGFISERLDGKGDKIEMHTSVVTGRAVQNDPRSNIIFYRSHFGGFGNVLNALLNLRDKSKEKLTIQSDLATVNLVSDSDLLKWLKIEYAGCTSHARRTFALHEDEDPDACSHMLHLFKGLYIYERGIDLFGRNFENTIAVRGIDGRKMWNEIKELAERMTSRWSAESKLGEKCRYIIRHYEKLTRYLSDPRLSPTNDFAERMLRMEKFIEDASCFRWSINGRFALDINRTVLQTAIAAQAPINDYIEFVLKAAPEDVEVMPEKYTPLAYAKTLPPQDTHNF